jgi:DNA-binding MarR family transcriptional regulator
MGTRSKLNAAGDGRFAYQGLDRAIHEKARLGILTSLVAHPEGLLFNDLKELCSLTDGNLNRHLAVLEEAQLVMTHRPAKRGRPQTTVVMTLAGRRRFQQYLNVLEQVLTDAAANQPQAAVKRERVVPRIAPA